MLQTGLICFFVAIILAMSHLVWSENYRMLEQQQVQEDAARVSFAWEEEIRVLQVIAEDWAPYADLYRFAQNPQDRNFADKNLTDAAMFNLKINTALVADRNGHIVFAKAIDFNTREEASVPEDVLTHIRRILSSQIITSLGQKPLGGFVVTDQGPVLLSIQRISANGKEVPSPGLLILGRYVDTKLFRELSRRTQVEMGFYEQKETVSFVPRGTRIFQKAEGDQYIRIYQEVHDLYGSGDSYVVATTPRTIHARWKALRTSSLIFVIGFGLLFIAITVFALDRVILARIRKMGEFMQTVIVEKRVSSRLVLTGNDELSAAAETMNNMLDRLEASQREIEALCQSVQKELEERTIAEQAIRHISMHDTLTGLYNRAYFEAEIKYLSERGLRRIGVISCDLDGLKLINDTMGHAAGDKLLVQAAQVLKSSFPQGSVARIGGDEFAVLLADIDEAEILQGYNCLKERISQHQTEDEGLVLKLSLGWKYYEGDQLSEQLINSLLKQADDIMYRQKLSSSQSNRSAIIQAMLEMLRVRDFATEGHSHRLLEYVQFMGQAAGLHETAITDLALLAQFHDIGKVGIPDSILLKPGKLTDQERQEMERHAEIGYRIAQSVTELAPIADLILKHHEWWNGQGYPLGLKGPDIPIEDRILAIVDAFDAMTSNRPYRPAMRMEEAVAELKRCAGTQFDPELVELFTGIIWAANFHDILMDKKIE